MCVYGRFGRTMVRVQFISPSSKNKKNQLLKIFLHFLKKVLLIFQKMELSDSKIKTFLIFSYILGNGNLWKF